MALNATAPTPRASSHSGRWLQSNVTKGLMPAIISSATGNPHTAASSTFSSSRPSRDTRPRTSRRKAFSSRSSASRPAARRIVTNMSDTVTDTPTAKASSGTRLPFSATRLTCTGLLTVVRTWSERLRFWIASWANCVTWLSAMRLAEPFGSVAIVASRIVLVFSSPRMSSVRPSRSKLPPWSRSLMSCAAMSLKVSASAELAWARREEMAWSTRRALTGSSLL